MKKIKLTKGPFKGRTLVFETGGETVEVICLNCGWQEWQTFFIKDYTTKDINRNCPRCGNEELIFGAKEG